MTNGINNVSRNAEDKSNLVAQPLISILGGQRRWISVGLRPDRSIKQVLGQPGLQSGTLSQK